MSEAAQSSPTPDAEAGTGPTLAIDEDEHQALDLLDELGCGSAWIAAQSARDEVLAASDPAEDGRARLDAAIVELGEDPKRAAEAEASVRELLDRIVGAIADRLLDAAGDLAAAEARGDLTSQLVDETRELLNASPKLRPAITPAVETTGVILGLDRSSIAWAILLSLGERAHAEAPARVRECSTAIAERLEAAHAIPEPPAALPVALRVFRSAAVIYAGPSIRARLLAAADLELLPLARELVARHHDPAALVESFDRARAAIAAAADPSQSEPETDDAVETTDGPKRKFTWVHLVLAAIVLGLTVWHYVFR